MILAGMPWLAFDADEGPYYQWHGFDRYCEAIRGMEKPKRAGLRRPLKPISNNEKRERLLIVQQLVNPYYPAGKGGRPGAGP